MKLTQFLAMAVLVGAATAGAACANQSAEETRKNVDEAADKTKVAAERVAEKTREVAVATGAVVSDGWITAKIKAKISDETVLNDSKIAVETKDHEVTLSGSVPSAPAKARALEIANGTEGVKRVVSQLVVK